MKIQYAFFLIINLLSFFLIGYDKLKAKNRGWRIPELNLFVLALIGGATGIFIGMKVFSHKTRHFSFRIGIPLLFGLNVLTVYLITSHFKPAG